MSEELDSFQWVFKISEVVKFEETVITVYANTYKQAVKKIRNLKLPSLEKFIDIEENLKLESVYEVNENIEDSEEETEIAE
jgi:hypothetical protein